MIKDAVRVTPAHFPMTDGAAYNSDRSYFFSSLCGTSCTLMICVVVFRPFSSG